MATTRINEIKLAKALGVGEVFLAGAEVVKEATGAGVGFAGPVGFKGKIIVDRDAQAVAVGITGANETDYHYKNVSPSRDFSGEVADIRSVKAADPCPNCNDGSLSIYRGIEAGHIFLLGTHYSNKMGATYLDDVGEKRVLVMGCYGIGVSRLVATAVEQFNDDNGICWPISLAPYQVAVVQLGTEPEVVSAVADLERDLEALGLSVLVDDRAVRPGVKFKDADLIGIPLRATVGKKSLERGGVELKPRSEPDPKKAELVELAQAAKLIAERIAAMQRALEPK